MPSLKKNGSNTFSIVIPTINAGAWLAALLSAIDRQTTRAETVLIVDCSSDDNTVETAESCGCKVLKINKHDFDHSTTRNLGIADTNSEFLVFLTQDVLFCNDSAIENIIRPLIKNPQIGVAFGKQVPYPDASVFAEHLRLFNYPDVSYIRTLEDKKKYGIKTAFLSNSFAAYRRSVLEEIGYFKKGMIFGEDTYAAAKMLLTGYKIAYVADAKVFHSHNYTVCQDFRRYFDTGVFHRQENWLLNEFGKAESQGIEYVKSAINFLWKRKRVYLLPELILRITMKYLGYTLGRKYIYLPKNLCKKFSMNRNWWDKPQKTSC